jgi:hypothetical protein
MNSIAVSAYTDEAFFPVGVVKQREGDRPFTRGGVDETALSYIEADVRSPPFALAKEEQVAGGDLLQSDGAGSAVLLPGGAGNYNAVALIGVID